MKGDKGESSICCWGHPGGPGLPLAGPPEGRATGEQELCEDPRDKPNLTWAELSRDSSPGTQPASTTCQGKSAS